MENAMKMFFEIYRILATTKDATTVLKMKPAATVQIHGHESLTAESSRVRKGKSIKVTAQMLLMLWCKPTTD